MTADTAVRRFRPYPAYKNSRVEWLATIPEHWEVKPLKHLTTFATGWTPPTGREDLYGGDHLWANIGDLGPKTLFTTEKTISDAAIRESRMRMAKAGSLLFSFKLSVGTVSLAGVDMYTNEAIAAFAPSDRIDTGYLYWAAPVLVPQNAQDNIYGAPLLSRDRIANALLLSPPVSEQRAIASFLDRETARIDALVSKKERLIELLQEKRTALITRAVTKGLDPNVPMKYSGIEWLGQIPAGWGITFLDKLVDPLRRITYGIVQPGEPDPDGIMMVRGQNYSRGWNGGDDIFRVSPEIEAPYRRARLKQGDLIMTIVGAGTGNIAIVPDWLEGANLTQTTARIALDLKKASNRYFAYQLQSMVGTVGVQLSVKGAAQPGLNLAHIAKFLVVVPPTDEQVRIADFLDSDTARLDILMRRVDEAVERLKELRTAIISGAVTGKIDVREEAL